MKETNKYSVYIYIIIPVLVAIWPVLVFAVYLPNAQKKLEKDISTYAEANNTMLDILTLAPERIESIDPNEEKVEFSYVHVIEKVAKDCDIDPSKYSVGTTDVSDTKAGKSQSANLKLSDIDITSFAKFLSVIQSRWPKLVCESVKLTKKKDMPDVWNITVKFQYYFTAGE